MQMQEPFQLVIFLRLGKLMYTPLCNRASGIYILTGFSEKTSPGTEANFPPGAPFRFCQVVGLPFQRYTNDICRVCKRRTGEATNWPSKI